MESLLTSGSLALPKPQLQPLSTTSQQKSQPLLYPQESLGPVSLSPVSLNEVSLSQANLSPISTSLISPSLNQLTLSPLRMGLRLRKLSYNEGPEPTNLNTAWSPQHIRYSS